jgi:hypothetical protein
MSLATRIRIELLWGPLTTSQLAKRLERRSSGLHCHLNQLCRAKKDPVIVVGTNPKRYALKRAYSALQDVWR